MGPRLEPKKTRQALFTEVFLYKFSDVILRYGHSLKSRPADMRHNNEIFIFLRVFHKRIVFEMAAVASFIPNTLQPRSGDPFFRKGPLDRSLGDQFATSRIDQHR